MHSSSYQRLSYCALELLDDERSQKRCGVSRRELLLTAVGIGSVTLLAACGGSVLPGSAAVPQPAKGPVTVTAMLTVTGAKLNAFPAQIGDPFKKLHPNVTLEGVPQSGGGTQQAMEQLTALIAGGTPTLATCSS